MVTYKITKNGKSIYGSLIEVTNALMCDTSHFLQCVKYNKKIHGYTIEKMPRFELIENGISIAKGSLTEFENMIQIKRKTLSNAICRESVVDKKYRVVKIDYAEAR